MTVCTMRQDNIFRLLASATGTVGYGDWHRLPSSAVTDYKQGSPGNLVIPYEHTN